MDELDNSARELLSFDLSEERDGATIVKLRGELDMTTAGRLESAVDPLILKSPQRLIIDAHDLEFADSSAIALLVRWASLVPVVELREPSELLRRVIARMGLSDQLHLTP